jgi:hypothetical protein
MQPAERELREEKKSGRHRVRAHLTKKGTLVHGHLAKFPQKLQKALNVVSAVQQLLSSKDQPLPSGG